MKRALSPSTNATGLGAAAAAIYAVVVMIWHWTHHAGVIDPQVLIAGAAAAWLVYTRFKVTPVADPRDGNGNPLHGPMAGPAPPSPPSNMTVVPGQPPPPAPGGPRL